MIASLTSRKRYLDLILVLIKRELKVKYRGSFFGYLWSMINPLLFMLIVSKVFAHIVKDIENFNLYVLSGILFWNFCSICLVLGTTSIVNNARLLQKVRVPAWIFPLVPVGVAATHLSLAMVPYAVLYFFSGRAQPSQLYLAPAIFILAVIFLLGVTYILACLNVFFRDVAHILEPIITLTFYATPIIYNRLSPQVPEAQRHLLGFNPFTHYVEAVRASVFGMGVVTWENLLLLFGLSASALLMGTVCYKISKNRMIFYL